MTCKIAEFPIQETLCRVVSNTRVNSEYLHLVLEAPETALAALPGQFFHFLCPPTEDDLPFLRRPMSVYRIANAERHIEFLYKNQGAGTRGLATLEPGDMLDVFGPLGKGFAFRNHRHILIVARGVGLATMAPLAEHAIKAGARVTAVLSARSPELVMSADYLKDAGAQVHIVTDTEGTSSPTAVEEILRGLHAIEPFDYAATCGSDRLLQLLKHLSLEWGITGQIALEQHMACGIGMCFCCVRPFEVNGSLTYRRVCFEGPVFDLAETPSW